MRCYATILCSLLVLIGVNSLRDDHDEKGLATSGLTNKESYMASVVYAAASSAAKFGAKIIVDRKKAGDGTKMEGAGWVGPFLTDIAGEDSPAECILFIDLGGGSLTGTVHVLDGESGSYKDGIGAEYKSKNHPEIVASDLEDIYGAKNTFNDYSRMTEGNSLNQMAGVLAKHIRKAYDDTKCTAEKAHADKVYIRQTGKIRYVELDGEGGKHWEDRMNMKLKKHLKVPFDYALLPSPKEARYEGRDFWAGGVDKFLTAVGGDAPAKKELMLCQVGSSSTQASTCTADTCDDESIVAAAHGVLGALPDDDQLKKSCADGENCFPDLETRMDEVLTKAGIASLGDHPVIAYLNAIGYKVSELFKWCLALPDTDASHAPCASLKSDVDQGKAVDPCEFVRLAATYGGFEQANDKC